MQAWAGSWSPILQGSFKGDIKRERESVYIYVEIQIYVIYIHSYSGILMQDLCHQLLPQPYVESQVAPNNRPLYPNVAHH